MIVSCLFKLQQFIGLLMITENESTNNGLILYTDQRFFTENNM